MQIKRFSALTHFLGKVEDGKTEREDVEQNKP
jgi:hypothetical protein